MAQINFPVATSAGQQFEGDNGVIYTYIGTPPNGFWSGSFQATGLTTLDSRYLKLDSSNDPITAGLNITGGNVGIGTSSPASLLHISSTVDTALKVQAASAVPTIELLRGNNTGFGTDAYLRLPPKK